MSTFKEIVGKIERELLGILGANAMRVGNLVDDLAHEHDRELSLVRDDLRQVKSNLAEARDKAVEAQSAERYAKNELVTANRLDKLWDKSDGRRIIEAAYAHDPKGVTMALNSLGGSLIAGELRDRATKAIQEEARRLVPFTIVAPDPSSTSSA
jgi:hypothetical protein